MPSLIGPARSLPPLSIVPWALAFALGLGLAATAHAETNNDELWLGGGGRALRSSSANALTHRNLDGASFGYARDLGIAVAPGLALWGELGGLSGHARGTMFQTLSTEIEMFGVTGGVRARYRLHRLVAASARLDLGVQRIGVELTDSGAAASDHGWATMASAGAALDLFARVRPPFGIGVRAELGYALAQGTSLTPQRSSSSDVLELPMTELALGSLDLSGPTFAISLVAQF